MFGNFFVVLEKNEHHINFLSGIPSDRVSNSLDQDQARHNDPNCLQRLCADDKLAISGYRVQSPQVQDFHFEESIV